MNKVSICKLEDSITETVKSAMEKAEWKNFITPSSNVSLKVNLGWDLFLPGSVTSSVVVEGVIKNIYDYVNKIFIVESGQVLVDVEKAARKTKIFNLSKKYSKVKWINLSKEKNFKKFKIESLNIEIEIPEILLKTEIITIPVLKTHGRCVISCAIKNQWGCLMELRHNYHPVLKEMLWEVNRILPVKFAVVDGVICLEGNGPKSGIPKICNLIISGSDILSVDMVCAKIMGFNPDEIEYLQYFKKKKNILDERIEVVGCDINKINLNFKPAKNNIVASIETKLRSSKLKKIAFNTRLFYIFCLGAKFYYFVWYYILGNGIRYKKRLRNSRLEAV